MWSACHAVPRSCGVGFLCAVVRLLRASRCVLLPECHRPAMTARAHRHRCDLPEHKIQSDATLRAAQPSPDSGLSLQLWPVPKMLGAPFATGCRGVVRSLTRTADPGVQAAFGHNGRPLHMSSRSSSRRTQACWRRRLTSHWSDTGCMPWCAPSADAAAGRTAFRAACADPRVCACLPRKGRERVAVTHTVRIHHRARF